MKKLFKILLILVVIVAVVFPIGWYIESRINIQKNLSADIETTLLHLLSGVEEWQNHSLNSIEQNPDEFLKLVESNIEKIKSINLNKEIPQSLSFDLETATAEVAEGVVFKFRNFGEFRGFKLVAIESK